MLAGFALLASGCLSLGGHGRPVVDPGSDYDWQLPPGLPRPYVPDDNRMSAAKVELGRRLFYDRRLSGNRTASCASCHQQALAFTDGRARAVGSTGEVHPRSSMSLVNVAYNLTFNWADPKLTRLEEQILVPMFNRHPVELGLAGRKRQVVRRLRSDSGLSATFARAFPDQRRPVTLTNARKAVASFVRTIIAADSAYDRYVFWDQRDALTPAARRGMALFFSERTHCSECHRAPLFTGGMRAATQPDDRVRAPFHNTGLYDVDGRGGYPQDNQGLFEHTGRPFDMGRFKAPTLRNVELTSPYMHDGSIDSLEQVLEFYAAGGRGAGRSSAYKDPLVQGFELGPGEKRDLVEFLEALTDNTLPQSDRFAEPSGRETGSPGIGSANVSRSWGSTSALRPQHRNLPVDQSAPPGPRTPLR